MAQWWKPYEAILEEKPKAIKEVLISELAKELLEYCELFPPKREDIFFLNTHQKERFAKNLEEMPKISPKFMRTLCTLLQYELEFNIDAVDHFFRNHLYKAACPTHMHLEALHFLRPVLLEMLFQRKEDCNHHLKNKDLISIVEQLEERFLKKRSKIISL